MCTQRRHAEAQAAVAQDLIIYIYKKTFINTIPVFLDDGFKYEAQKGSRLASGFLACRIKGCFVPRGPDSHDLNRQVERAKDPFRC